MLEQATRFYRKARRRLWMKYALRGVNGADNHARLELAYRIPDPWNMQSSLEQDRFEQTNRLIEHAFGHVGSVLELGCGEGHQSAYLGQVADQVFGVDVSPTAIERAHQRVPQAQFAVAEIATQAWFSAQHKVDLVVACEMLYAIKDVAATLAEMRQRSRACLLTVHAPGMRRVAPHLKDIPGLHKDWILHGSTVWLACWWRNE